MVTLSLSNDNATSTTVHTVLGSVLLIYRNNLYMEKKQSNLFKLRWNCNEIAFHVTIAIEKYNIYKDFFLNMRNYDATFECESPEFTLAAIFHIPHRE